MNSALAQKLSLLGLTAMVVGSMIGAGIFSSGRILAGWGLSGFIFFASIAGAGRESTHDRDAVGW